MHIKKCMRLLRVVKRLPYTIHSSIAQHELVVLRVDLASVDGLIEGSSSRGGAEESDRRELNSAVDVR